MVSDELLRQISDFIHHEGRLCDLSRYADWEALWTDDAHYWVPRADGLDPEEQVSHINDNRRRIHTRIQQLLTGTRHSQLPASPMTRVISGITVEAIEGDDYLVGSNFILLELAVQSTHDQHVWGGRLTHRLRRTADGWRMAGKKVVLVNADEPIPNLSFLI